MSYWISRRSVRVWPISGEGDTQMREAFKEFKRDALRITQRDIESIQVERIRRTRSSPGALSYKEVCVTFSEIDDRDFIASKAVNLGTYVNSDGKPQAGVRLDVPAFLLPTFRDLNSYAYCVRKMHGKSTKTHVKFDDSNLNLHLELRLPSSDNWLKISPQRARELTTENNANELRKLQSELRERNIRQEKLEDSSWSTSSVNSIPLGTTRSWRPPPRDFGGDR